MKRVIPYIIPCLLCFAGCQSELTKDDKIETKISNAIFKGQSAEEIKQLIVQADDPSKVAIRSVLEVMDLNHLPTEIEKSWAYYRDKDTSSTPSIEIFEIINRYKISVLQVLVPYEIDFNQKYYDRPIVRWNEFTAITPDLLKFLLEHGYDANITNDYPNALDFCARPNHGMLRYDQKYEMITMLLEHNTNPNVTSMGMPILHELIVYQKDNPFQLDILELLLEAGADVNVIDNSGNTVLDRAISLGNDELTGEIIDILKRYNAKRSVEI